MESRQPPQLFASTEPQKLLKAKVQVCGRFLLRPDDEFGPERAEELVRRVVKDNARVRTNLVLFNTGIRLGENGLFASMPLEHIKYQRILACISPRQSQPQRMLALCTRDYEQKCVTVLQFKDPAALAEASRLIDRQHRLAAEEANYLPDTPVKQTATSNWAMQTAAREQLQQQQQQPQRQPRPSSFSADSGFPGFGPLERGSSQPAVMTEVSPSIQRPVESPRNQNPPEARIKVVTASSASASMADDVFYEQRQTTTHVRSTGQAINSVILNYDDLTAGATYAVFESQNGPPTLLNERDGSADQSKGRSSARPATLRVQTTSASYDHSDRVDGGSRPQVTYVKTGPRSSVSMQQQRQLPQQQLVQLQYSPPPQASGQLVKLVPVRRRVPHQQYVYLHQQNPHQQQYYALQPVSSSRGSLGRGHFRLVSK